MLLYGSENWVVMGAMLKMFEGFHYKETRLITRMTARCAEDGEWEYPPVVDATEEAGLWQIKEYI